MKRIDLIAGARSNFMKIAPIIDALYEPDISQPLPPPCCSTSAFYFSQSDDLKAKVEVQDE